MWVCCFHCTVVLSSAVFPKLVSGKLMCTFEIFREFRDMDLGKFKHCYCPSTHESLWMPSKNGALQGEARGFPKFRQKEHLMRVDLTLYTIPSLLQSPVLHVYFCYKSILIVKSLHMLFHSASLCAASNNCSAARNEHIPCLADQSLTKVPGVTIGSHWTVTWGIGSLLAQD